MKKKVKPVEDEPQAVPEVEAPAVLPPAGPSVLYVLDTGPNAGAVRPGVLLDQGGAHERIEVQTEPADGLPNPLTVSLTQYIGAPAAPVHSNGGEPGSWHWPAP